MIGSIEVLSSRILLRPADLDRIIFWLLFGLLALGENASTPAPSEDPRFGRVHRYARCGISQSDEYVPADR
jgi:hypothetical protein